MNEIEQSPDEPDSVSYAGIRSESERQLKSIVSFLPDATFAIDKKGRVIAWNRAMESMTGVKADDILGKGEYEYSLPFYGFRQPILIDLVLQPDPNLEAEYESMERDGMSLTGEVFIPSFGKSGSHIWAKASPLYDSSGEVSGAIESLRDITERKKTEGALKESESKFRLLFERSADAMFLMDGKKFIDCNNAAIEMMKSSSRDELLDIHPSEISPESQADGHSSREKSEEMIKKAFEKGTHKFEWMRRRSNGEEFPATITLTAIPWKSEQILHVTVKDITERKAAEKALLESRELYRNLVENLNDIILFLDPSGRITYISPVVEQAFGYSPRELLGRSFEEHIHEEDLAGVKERFEQAITGELKNYEFRVRDKGNQIRYVRASARLSGVLSSLKGLTVTLTDITDHKEAEMELKESEDRYRLLVESSPDGIIIHMDGSVIFANKASALLLNADTPEELVGQPVMSFVHQDYRHAVRKRIHSTQIIRDATPLIEEKFLRVDGTEIDVEAVAIPFTFKGKSATQVVFRDIIKRKKTEEALQEAKLAAEASKAQYEQVVSMLSDIVWSYVVNDKGECIGSYISPVADRMLGLPDGTIGDSIDKYFSYVHPDDLPEVNKALSEGIGALAKDVTQEYRLLKADGTTIWVRSRGSAYAQADGHITAFGTTTDITERRRAEDSLKHSESKYRLLYSSLMDAFVSTDMDGRITECNRSYLNMLGYEPDEINAFTYRDLTPDRWHSFEEEMVQKQILPRGYSDIYEKEYMRKDGTIFPVELRTFLLRDESGISTGMSAIVRDITERKHLEKMLIQERDRAEQLLDIAGVIILALDTEGIVTLINEKGCQILGCGREEIVGKNWTQTFLPEKIRDKMTAVFKKLVADEIESVGHFENPILTLQGDERIIAWQNSAIRDENGNIAGTLSSGEDVTERKQADEALRQSEERFRAIFDSGMIGIVASVMDGKVQVCNCAFQKMVGYSAEELKGMRFSDFTHPDDLVAEENLVEELIRGKHPFYTIEKRYIHKKGNVVWARLLGIALRNSLGGITGGICVIEDITERKQAENALMESEERYRTLSDAAPDLVFIINKDDKVEYINNTAARYLGLQPQDVVGKARSELFPPDISDAQKFGLQKVFDNGGAVHSSVNKAIFCGREVWIDTQMVPLRKDSEGVTAVLGVSRDITELKRSEEILRNAKEVAEAATRAKSEFLANMSHEIRTPMNAVIGMTGLLLDEDLTTNQKEYLETIRRSGDALLSIINNILDLSKIEAGVTDLEYQPFDLHRCVEASLDLVSADASMKGIRTKCEFDDNTPAVMLGDPTRLSQILVNLLSNAVKFTEKGVISVSVSSKRLEGENYEVHFAVKDTGIGIPQDKMERLFKSFSQIDSSTTRKYGGTGLGLVISKKLVEMMKGTIWVESEPSLGTTFHFTINVEKTLHEPIDVNRLDSKSDARLQGNLGHHLSILLAEDNLINQMVTQRMLNKLGWRADIANNGIEVLRALERRSYDVIIMDVLMPEMDGLEATREIRRRWPGCCPKIIAMTASVLKGDRETCLAAGMDGYISKPTKLAELKSVLESNVNAPK